MGAQFGSRPGPGLSLPLRAKLGFVLGSKCGPVFVRVSMLDSPLDMPLDPSIQL